MPERPIHDLHACVDWGVTAISSTGDPITGISRLRDNEQGRLITSPRIQTTGPVVTARGGYPACFLPAPVAADATRQVNSPEAVEAVIQELAAARVDRIKVVYDAGSQWSHYPKLSVDLLKAIVDHARENGLRVTARVGTLADLKDAISAGINAVDEGPFEPLDSDAVALMVQHRIFFCSLLATTRSAAASPEEIDGLLALEEVRHSVSSEIRDGLARHLGYFFDLKHDRAAHEEFRAEWMNRIENLRRAYAGGVKIVLATGAGDPAVFYGPAVHDELRMMVDAGMPASDALTAATRTAADYLGLADRLGTIQPNRLADLVIVDGDPQAGILASRKIRYVIKGSQVIEPGRAEE
jgi:imidazolonepropionase-like amidohydrolase